MAGRAIRLTDLIEHIGLSRSAIYDRMNAKSPRHDPSFPRSFRLNGAAVAWYLEDVDRWLQSCSASGPKEPTGRRLAASSEPQEQGTQARLGVASVAPPTASPQPAPTSLAEALLVGSQLNRTLMTYLQMAAWSPAMAALLVSGVEPPVDCQDIPAGGKGLDGKNLHASDVRLHHSRRVLKAWIDQEEYEGEAPLPAGFTPYQYLEWCAEEKRADNEWLRYFFELVGWKDSDAADFSSPRLDLALRQAKLK